MADSCRRSGLEAPAREEKFIYTVKVSEHITHIKKFKGTETLVKILE